MNRNPMQCLSSLRGEQSHQPSSEDSGTMTLKKAEFFFPPKWIPEALTSPLTSTFRTTTIQGSVQSTSHQHELKRIYHKYRSRLRRLRNNLRGRVSSLVDACRRMLIVGRKPSQLRSSLCSCCKNNFRAAQCKL